MTLLTARYVAPVDAPVIENGAVRIQSGRIVEVGVRSDMSAESVVDHGDAVICPGFVNAHTHLELSHLTGRIPPGPNLADWLGRLVSTLRSESTGDRSGVPGECRGHNASGSDVPPDQSPDRKGAAQTPSSHHERRQDSVRDGIVESIRHGVTVVGDITANPKVVRPVLAASNLKSVSFGEVIAIGRQRELLTERLDAALSSEEACARLRVGVSPHAPYTVEPDGLVACARRAAAVAAPLCIHLAESTEEDKFTSTATGPLAEHLKSLGVWDERIQGRGQRAIELADASGILTNRTIVAHANYVSDEDIALLASRGASVAFCPRTHHAFGHEPHRFLDMLRGGVNVCIGTDSLASNPSLSILEELRFLYRQREGIDPELLLAMGTLNGARALGWSDAAGALRPGVPADLVVIPFEQALRTAGLAAMFQTGAPPRAVYVAGVLQRESR